MMGVLIYALFRKRSRRNICNATYVIQVQYHHSILLMFVISNQNLAQLVVLQARENTSVNVL